MLKKTIFFQSKYLLPYENNILEVFGKISYSQNYFYPLNNKTLKKSKDKDL